MRYTISLALASLTFPAVAEVPRVVTDIPPVHSLVAQVMGDLGAPVLLTERGANPHDMALRPSQAAAVQEAGLVVWIGPELTPWLVRALDGLGPEVPRLGLLAAPGTELREYGEDDHDHDHEDHDHEGHAHDDHADHDHEGHDDHAHDDHGHSHEGTDPHAWLDPANAQLWLGLIAGELGRLDPPNAAAYAANAATAAEALAAEEAWIAALLEPLHDRPFVVFHDAYGYFAGHFGLTVAGSISLGDAAAPGAARLRELQAEIGAQGLCVFPEANHDARLAAQLAEAAGARLGPPLDPEGMTLEPGPGLYAALLGGLAEGIADCLSAP